MPLSTRIETAISGAIRHGQAQPAPVAGPADITAEYNGRIDNLSFERLFGKLIALQGMAATIAAGAGNRRVTKAVHTATSVFIPLPL